MKVLTSVKELRAELDRTERSGIGFVPTMGALHAGHRSLVERARRENRTVVVSVFVNPTQFNDKNDLKHYPRTPEADERLLAEAGADFVLMPPVEEIYPEPDTRVFDFGQVDKVMAMTPAELKAWVVAEVERNPLLKVIYYQSVDALTMQEVAAWSDAGRIQGCIAVQAGEIRLIDNIRIR